MTVGNGDVVPNTVDTQFCNKSPFLYSLVRKTTRFLCALDSTRPSSAMAFAISPANAHANNIVNFATAAGAKLYKQATTGLFDGGDLYDLHAERLKTFLDSFQDRIVEQSWTSTFSIPEHIVVPPAAGPAPPPAPTHLLTQAYGRVSLAQVRTYVDSFIGQNRISQNSYMSYMCLMASLNEDAKAQVNLRREDFIIDDVGSGPLLLKVIISLAYVDTEATVMVLRQRLSDLHIHIADFNGDIIKFNSYVKATLQGLHARGERTLDLLPNLFKAYETVSDENFLEMIRCRKNAYEEGDSPNLSATQLMDWARLKYQGLVEAKKWQALSERDQKIIALEAKVKKMEKGKTAPLSTTKGSKQGKQKTKESAKESWLTIGPHEGGPEVKEVNGKMYYWCKWHEKWSLNKKHTSDTCNGRGLTGEKKKAYDLAHAEKNNDGTTPALRLASALADLPAQEESSDEE